MASEDYEARFFAVVDQLLEKRTTPLYRRTPSDQGFHTDPTIDGILKVHPSDTPQDPSSQACGCLPGNATKPQP